MAVLSINDLGYGNAFPNAHFGGCRASTVNTYWGPWRCLWTPGSPHFVLKAQGVVPSLALDLQSFFQNLSYNY